MKLIFLTLFLALFASSWTLGSRRLNHQISIHSLHLEKISTIGSAIKGLIQLADAQDFESVVDIIGEVLNEFEGNLSAQRQALAQLTQNQEDNLAQVEESLTNLNGQLKDAESQLETQQGNQVLLSAAIGKNVDAINAASEAIADEHARRQVVEDANEQHIQNINDAVETLTEAEAFEEALENGLPGGASFIQAQTKKFSKTLSLVQKKLSKTKLKLSTTDLYITELVKIAQDAENSSEIDRELIDQIFDLLESFKQSLAQEAQQTQSADDADEQNSENALAILQNTVDTQREILEKNQDDLALATDAVSNLEGVIAALEENIQNAVENHENIRAVYAEQSEIVEGVIEGLEVDVDVLQRALVFVTSEAAAIDSSDAQDVLADAPALDDEPRPAPPTDLVPEVAVDPSADTDGAPEAVVGPPVAWNGSEEITGEPVVSDGGQRDEPRPDGSNDAGIPPSDLFPSSSDSDVIVPSDDNGSLPPTAPPTIAPREPSDDDTLPPFPPGYDSAGLPPSERVSSNRAEPSGDDTLPPFPPGYDSAGLPPSEHVSSRSSHAAAVSSHPVLGGDSAALPPRSSHPAARSSHPVLGGDSAALPPRSSHPAARSSHPVLGGDSAALPPRSSHPVLGGDSAALPPRSSHPTARSSHPVLGGDSAALPPRSSHPTARSSHVLGGDSAALPPSQQPPSPLSQIIAGGDSAGLPPQEFSEIIVGGDSAALPPSENWYREHAQSYPSQVSDVLRDDETSEPSERVRSSTSAQTSSRSPVVDVDGASLPPSPPSLVPRLPSSLAGAVSAPTEPSLESEPLPPGYDGAGVEPSSLEEDEPQNTGSTEDAQAASEHPQQQSSHARRAPQSSRHPSTAARSSHSPSEVQTSQAASE